MPFSRTLPAIVCIAGLIALPAAATGAKKRETAFSHVIKTSKGSQLAVPVTVRYRLRGQRLDRSRLTTRTAIAARLPGGRVLRAVEKRQLPGTARVKVEHHPFFSVRQTRVLRKVLRSGRKVKLTVANSLTADTDGDGDIDARAKRAISQVLAKPSAPTAPAPTLHQEGNDPCGARGLSSAICRNVAGRTVTARHLWASSTVRITCPAAFPYPANSVSTATNSERYTQTVLYPSGPTAASVRIIDDNPRGHPYAYTPTAACTKTNLDGLG